MWRILQMIVTPLANLGKDRGCRVAALGGLFSLACLGLLWSLVQASVWAYETTNRKIAETLDMRVRDVEIVGADTIDVAETLERHGVQVGSLVADIDWDGAREDLERNPMVLNASIARLSPERIHVAITPRKPIARIDRPGADRDTILVDKSGYKVRVSGMASDKDLIALSGKGAFGTIDSFWPLLTAEPVLFDEVKEARYIGERRWDLILKTGAVVQLPEDDVGLALRRLGEIMASGRLDLVALRTIDLRTAERLFIRTKQGLTEEKNVKAQSQG